MWPLKASRVQNTRPPEVHLDCPWRCPAYRRSVAQHRDPLGNRRHLGRLGRDLLDIGRDGSRSGRSTPLLLTWERGWCRLGTAAIVFSHAAASFELLFVRRSVRHIGPPLCRLVTQRGLLLEVLCVLRRSERHIGSPIGYCGEQAPGTALVLFALRWCEQAGSRAVG